MIVGLFDQSFGQLQSTLQQLVTMGPAAFMASSLAAVSEQAQAIQLENNRLTWLVYMIGEASCSLTTIGSIYLCKS